MRLPLPAPTLLESWQTLWLRLQHRVRHPRHAETLIELREWYWDGAAEELSDAAARALHQDCEAAANFEALLAMDMDSGGDQSAVAHMLAREELSEQEIRLLRGALQSRLRIMHFEPCGELGLQKAIDRNSGQSFWIESGSWPVPIEGHRDYLVRIVAFASIALVAGPCFPLPSERSHPLRREAEDMLAALMRVPGAGLRCQRESCLVDFHHQWAAERFGDLEGDVVLSPPFTLLRGA
ncbi:MAG: hypothetical protein H6830_06220 [Planctomycetes bacterium]|nr:hypothetical protein [Planctomycetota bacterium]MCB9911633.1 hypothetical protein [Planctomycetota bacterium]HPF15407.1 hypothetical protein [Planctomycetota bacterium]HRV81339.1 hypothetical protein [Planctomycetota bacterium]